MRLLPAAGSVSADHTRAKNVAACSGRHAVERETLSSTEADPALTSRDAPEGPGT